MSSGLKTLLPTSTAEVGVGTFTSPDAVKVTGEPVNPAEVAVAVLGPSSGPSVNAADAIPSVAVVDTGGATAPPPAVTAQSTETPATGLPNSSSARTCSATGSAASTSPV